MITLPEGFSISTYISDYLTLALPFVSISFAFLVYKIIKKSLGAIYG